ncbi:ATP-binding protein [Candidatus Ruthia endofausta]|uniref:ATP-binding protein n=1 Tax=Candidatus Ruthia endofausta TaxID=2738852 RepID=A0A6N0HRE6_9GAMM|nr:ATP-binding protein [Candidatus Ruthia endofausta]
MIRKRVIKAHSIQLKKQGKSNDKLAPDEIEKLINLSQDNKQLLSNVIDKLNLSARAYHRILRVARIITDLDESKMVDKSHLVETVGYRRFNW